MKRADLSLLLLSGSPPFPLPREGSMTLGRSRACDLPLADKDVSRRHATIAYGPSGYTLRDLSSTNGTFVNGESTCERVLVAGDRIRVGGTDITFYVVGTRPVREPLSVSEAEIATAVSIDAAPLEVLSGNLQAIPPCGLSQLLEMERKSGVVHFEGERPGRLWFVDGVPIHAESGEQTGEVAALHLLGATSGRFRFEPGARADARSIAASVTELVLQVAKLEDEEQARRA